ncbi:hypothetical protein AHF37_09316 [Paragonimus kellicotti]|nr:hypothetical protein AHF37_09316 [Paragonimus kellicotti]
MPLPNIILSNKEVPGLWSILNAEVVTENGIPIGTKTPTQHTVLASFRLEGPNSKRTVSVPFRSVICVDNRIVSRRKPLIVLSKITFLFGITYVHLFCLRTCVDSGTQIHLVGRF